MGGIPVFNCRTATEVMRQTSKIACKAMFCIRLSFLQCFSILFWIVCPALLVHVLPDH